MKDPRDSKKLMIIFNNKTLRHIYSEFSNPKANALEIATHRLITADIQ